MTPPAAVEFRPGGAVTVRVLDPGEGDVAAIARQLGPPEPVAGSDAADIAIRFVERLPDGGSLRWIGLDDAAATDAAFVVLRGSRKRRVRVSLPLDEAGGPLTILAERPSGPVPLLVHLVNLAALGHGVVPLHASAVVHRGAGILIVGWSKGGKTETVLSLMGRGATFIGDEWIHLRPDRRAVGLPEPCRIWDWQLAQLPWLAEAVGRAERAGLRLTGGIAAAVGLARRAPGIAGNRVGSVLDRAEPIVRRQLSVQIPPERLFPGRLAAEARIDAVVLAVSEDRADVAVAPIELPGLLESIVQSGRHERLDLVAAATKFRFAFPHRPTDAIDTASDRERALLATALAGIPAWRLAHPYPPRIADLAPAIEAVIRAEPARPGEAPPEPGGDG